MKDNALAAMLEEIEQRGPYAEATIALLEEKLAEGYRADQEQMIRAVIKRYKKICPQFQPLSPKNRPY